MTAGVPADWGWSADEVRALGYRAVDIIAEYLSGLSQRQVFRPYPGELIRRLSAEPVPTAGASIDAVLDEFVEHSNRIRIGRWVRRIAAWWEDHDLLVTPTVGSPTPPLGWFTEEGPAIEPQRIRAYRPYTALFNITGQPAMSVPPHWTPDGLPVGVHVVAAYGREDLLIRVASQLEQAAPWADRRPPVHA